LLLELSLLLPRCKFQAEVSFKQTWLELTMAVGTVRLVRLQRWVSNAAGRSSVVLLLSALLLLLLLLQRFPSLHTTCAEPHIVVRWTHELALCVRCAAAICQIAYSVDLPHGSA
jgi:hypothetical protein